MAAVTAQELDAMSDADFETDDDEMDEDEAEDKEGGVAHQNKKRKA